MKRLLAISPTPTHPPSMGNRTRTLTLLQHFEATDCRVHFLHVDRERGDDTAMRAYWGERFHSFPYAQPRRPKLRPWFVPYYAGRIARAWRQGERFTRYNCGLDDWYDPRLDPFLRELHDRWHFDAVLVNYAYMSRALCAFPDGVVKLLDTHDVYGDRYKLYLAAGMPPAFYSCSIRDEVCALERAHAALAIQKEEAQYFRRLTQTPVLWTGHAVPLADHGPPPPEPTILFVGSRNSINREATTRFCRNILPMVRRDVPNASLMLVGSICEYAFDAPGVQKCGEVDDLDEAYAQARCVLNMRHIGSGLSIKSIEAMAHGRPLVATPAGAMGLMDGRDSAFLLAESDEAFAQAVVRVLKDDALALRLSAQAQAYAEAYNARCFEELDGFLARVLPPDNREG